MTIQSVFAIGCIIGMLMMPILCDMHGRKSITNATLFLLFVGNLFLFTGIYFGEIFQLLAGQFLSAFGSSAMTGLTYPICSDFFSSERRQKSIITFCLFWGFTDMSVMVIWYIIPYWWFYTIFLLVLPISALFLYFRTFFIESIHFVINVHCDFEEASQLLD